MEIVFSDVECAVEFFSSAFIEQSKYSALIGLNGLVEVVTPHGVECNLSIYADGDRATTAA